MSALVEALKKLQESHAILLTTAGQKRTRELSVTITELETTMLWLEFAIRKWSPNEND